MAEGPMGKSLIEGLTEKFDNQEDCDVMFSVDGKRIGAHKVVLAIRSHVLDGMASGWNRGMDPILIDTIEHKWFKALLRFLYSGEIHLTNANVFIFLAASVHYQMHYLEKLCVDYISNFIQPDNVCNYMNEAVLFESKALQDKCMEVFSSQTLKVVRAVSFCDLSHSALSAFLDSEETDVIEITLFHFVKWWAVKQCQKQGLPFTGTNMRHVLGDALYKIRFPTITAQDFANSVTTIDGFLTDTEIAQVFRKIMVFDHKDVECAFSSVFRCQVSLAYTSLNDMKGLCEMKVLYMVNSQEQFDISSMLKHVRDLPDDLSMFPPSFPLLLQCCADMANSGSFLCRTGPHNKSYRNELYDEFHTWKGAAEERNVNKIMTKFMEMRSKFDKLYEWSLI